MPQDRSLDGGTVRLSILDRLIDDQPENRENERPLNAREAFRAAIAGVRRDLEDLLNSREAWVEDLRRYEETSRTIVSFGISGIDSETEREDSTRWFRQEIERAIAVFEPRLTSVVVTAEEQAPNDRQLRFRIEAMLRLDPIREPVTFDTVIQANRQARVEEV